MLLPGRLLRREPLQRRGGRRRLVGHLHDHMLTPDWGQTAIQWSADPLGGRQVSSPGDGEGQRDVQRRPLVAVLGAQTEAGRLAVGQNRQDLQVSGVQSLQQKQE